MPDYPDYALPHITFAKQFQELWWTADSFYESRQLIISAFGEKYFSDTHEKVVNRNKDGIHKFFVAPLIYKHVSYPSIEHFIWIYEIANMLKILIGQASAKEYICRLMDEKKCYPTLFELTTAIYLYDLGIKVRLQEKNPLWNPVEISFSDIPINFWIECKTTEFGTEAEPFPWRLVRKLMPEIQSFPSATWIRIVLSNRPTDEKHEKIIIAEIRKQIKEYSANISSLPEVWEMPFCAGNVYYFKISAQNEWELAGFFQENCGELMIGHKPSKNDVSAHLASGSSNARDIIWIGIIVGVTYDKSYAPKAQAKKAVGKLLEDIKGKMAQQKTLMEDPNNEVILVLDYSIYNIEADTIKSFIFKLHPYPNLTIVLASYEPDASTWKVKKTFYPLIISKQKDAIKKVFLPTDCKDDLLS